MVSKSLTEYLKTIYVIKNQGEMPRVTDIAEKMNCTKASVNKSLKLLTKEGLINYESYGQIEITEEGAKLAKEIKKVMKDSTLNKLAKYLHTELGLYSLDCGYDINNEHCIDCARRKIEK